MTSRWFLNLCAVLLIGLLLSGLLVSVQPTAAQERDPLCIVDVGMIYDGRALVLFFCDNETRQMRIVQEDLVKRLNTAMGPLWLRKSEIR